MTYVPTEVEQATLPAAMLAALAVPHTHEIVTTYKSGKVRRFTTRSETSAENFASRERSKIGRKLIDRDTGKTVCVVSVEVRPITE